MLNVYCCITAVSSVSKKIGRQTSQPALREDEDSQEPVTPDPIVMTPEVLVVTFGTGANDCPGTLPEHKVIQQLTFFSFFSLCSFFFPVLKL